MTFFYDLNKKLDSIRAKPEVTHKQLNERDMSRAAKGNEKFTKPGMKELSRLGKAGASKKTMDAARKKYNQYDEGVTEQQLGEIGDTAAGKAALTAVQNRAYDKMDAWSANPKSGFSSTPKDVQKATSAAVAAGNRLHGFGPNKLATNTVTARSAAEGIEDRLKDLDPKEPVNIPAYQRRAAEQGRPVKKTGGVPMTAKQKSFAALAPPADKITFADKIAGAKKEVDEMLGDVAAEAMKSALGRGKKVVADEGDDNSPFTAHKRPRVDTPKVGDVERGAKHDIEHTATGRRVTRRVDAQGMSVGTDDEAAQSSEPRGRGRPKKAGGPAQERVTAKSRKADRTTYQGKKKATEGADDPAERGEYDREGDMALDDIDTIQSAAQELQSIIDTDENLPEWVQSKINKAMDYLDTARDYMAAQGNDDEEQVTEKAVSKKQQRFMGMVHAAQKGKKPASKAVADVAKEMPKKAAKDFASTRHEGLPEKKKPESKKKEKTEEAGGTDTPTASSGFSFGKGIYDSINRELEDMISESMNISMNMSNDEHGGPRKSLTVTATDEDAAKLASLLKMAGLGGSGVCPRCGTSPCSCQQMDEAYGETEATQNAPDYPTNTEYTGMKQSTDPVSNDLNRNKRDVAGDGQTTVPVTAVHAQDQDELRRMMEMAGIKESDRKDFFYNPDLPDDEQLPAPPEEIYVPGMDNEQLPAPPEEIHVPGMDEEVDDDDGIIPADEVPPPPPEDKFWNENEELARMMEMAGVKKKEVDEEKTEEGNRLTGGLEDDNIKVGEKIPGTNVIKKKDIDEGILASTANLWKAYKG